MPARPPFIVSASDIAERPARYTDDQGAEELAPARPIGRVAGLLQIGVHLVRVPPGRRTTYPHAESAEEEFAFVLEGEIDAWIDGDLHRMKVGDFAAFPAGTGICHTFLNNGDREALLLIGGEADKANGRVYYPLNPERRDQMPWSRWWGDAPARHLGPHDGKPYPRKLD